jgi:hypothetical protein
LNRWWSVIPLPRIPIKNEFNELNPSLIEVSRPMPHIGVATAASPPLRVQEKRDRPMKTMFLAAAAVLCISAGVAYAGDGGEGGESGGTIPNSYFTELPGALPQYGPQPNDVAVTNQYQYAPLSAKTAVAVPSTNNGG